MFSSPRRPPGLGSTQPPIQWVPRAISPVVKRQVREGDHLPPASVEVKKMWIYTSTSPYVFMALWLISYAQGQFHFYLNNLDTGYRLIDKYWFCCHFQYGTSRKFSSRKSQPLSIRVILLDITDKAGETLRVHVTASHNVRPDNGSECVKNYSVEDGTERSAKRSLKSHRFLCKLSGYQLL
jgi:hypothetical protein